VPGSSDPALVPRGGGDVDLRQLRRLVRSAATACYGVVAVVGPRWYERLLARLGVSRSAGVRVEARPALSVTLDLRVARAVPAAQVASNVAEVVRYRVQRDLGRTIERLTVRVDGKTMSIGGAPAVPGGR
jgi:uncharacterized alkaline shock family protein YloU